MICVGRRYRKGFAFFPLNSPHPLFVPVSQALVIWPISSSTHPFKVKYKIEISGFVSCLSLSELLNFIAIIDLNTHHQKDDV